MRSWAGRRAISDCLIQNQGAGELATGRGGDGAGGDRAEPRGARPAGRKGPFELGYLVGAVRRGAEDTAGVHAELIRRVETAARFSPAGRPLPASFEAAYRRGLRAGLEGG